MRLFLMLLAAGMALAAHQVSRAHGGGLNAEGCHNDRKNGGYHCHRGSAGPSRPAPKEAPGGDVYYQNCTSARAAGAAPVRVGDPGYSRKLDRDGDGVGCE